MAMVLDQGFHNKIKNLANLCVGHFQFKSSLSKVISLVNYIQYHIWMHGLPDYHHKDLILAKFDKYTKHFEVKNKQNETKQKQTKRSTNEQKTFRIKD